MPPPARPQRRPRHHQAQEAAARPWAGDACSTRSIHTAYGGVLHPAGDESQPAVAQEPAAQPSASPLRSLRQNFAQLAQEQQRRQQPAAAGGAPGRAAVATALRTWKWFDPADEREWQKRELARQYPSTGVAHLRNVPTSMKKMDRILRLVRGLHLEEARRQCMVLPHKAARYTQEVLEHAFEDALDKGLDESKLVVDVIYTTKGEYLKKKGYKGRGHATIITMRRCHVLAHLRELPVPYAGFRADTVPPLTFKPTIQSAAGKPAPPGAPRAPLLVATSAPAPRRVARHREL